MRITLFCCVWVVCSVASGQNPYMPDQGIENSLNAIAWELRAMRWDYETARMAEFIENTQPRQYIPPYRPIDMTGIQTMRRAAIKHAKYRARVEKRLAARKP